MHASAISRLVNPIQQLAKSNVVLRDYTRIFSAILQAPVSMKHENQYLCFANMQASLHETARHLLSSSPKLCPALSKLSSSC